MAEGPDPLLLNAAIYLGSSVVAVAAFKRLGLGSVLGYLAAGALIGPSFLGLIEGSSEVLHVAEFGVVLLLFVIGLELQPSRLWRMRGEIFGLGSMQLGVTGLVIAAELWLVGFAWAGALLVGLSLALSSTAFGVQIMRERGEFATPYARRAFSILLFQDMAVVPLLALAALLAPIGTEKDAGVGGVLLAIAAIAGLIAVGKYGLPWLFRLLALAKADEVFTAAALLVVAGAALAMQSVGLSMAIGAFLAGVMLAETEFRHQVETDIEPFRSLFLGLFFIAVGMSVDWRLALDNAFAVISGSVALFATKAAVMYRLLRRTGSPRADALRIASTLGQAGEFAFVLLAIASETWLIGRGDAALLTAAVGVSMALTPAAVKLVDLWEERREAAERRGEGLDGVDKAKPARVIVAGFGRSGQIIARVLRMRGYDLTLIDNSPRRIKMAEQFGDKVFFGDGSRLDVLTMAGAAEAKAIFLCINDREGAQKAVARLRERFPDQLILAMTYDRFTDIQMRAAGADEVIREVYESAVELARRGLKRMGDNADLDELFAEFRRRDEEMLRLQIELGMKEGVHAMREKYAIKT
jgi:monovalent cation:proton antiporter-2 (CPA2) family protein